MSKHVAVLMGGSSAEREVSLMSGTAVLEASPSPVLMPEAKNALNTAMRRELCELLRSADRDPEVTAVVLCRDFAEQTASMLEVDFARCVEVGASDYADRPLSFRMLVQLSRLFSPIL